MQSPYAALAGVLLFLALLLALCLAWLTYVFLFGSLCSYAVAAGDGAVTLFVEPFFGRHGQITINRSDINYLEYFTLADRQSLVCHLHDGRMIEIPLWALPKCKDLILQTLSAPDVKILTI